MAATELKGDIRILFSYNEAMSDKRYRNQWEQAIREEWQAFESFNTWTLMDRDSIEDRKLIGCHWVLLRHAIITAYFNGSRPDSWPEDSLFRNPDHERQKE